MERYLSISIFFFIDSGGDGLSSASHSMDFYCLFLCMCHSTGRNSFFFFFYNRTSIRFPFFVVCFAHSGGREFRQTKDKEPGRKQLLVESIQGACGSTRLDWVSRHTCTCARYMFCGLCVCCVGTSRERIEAIR